MQDYKLPQRCIPQYAFIVAKVRNVHPLCREM